MRALAIVMLVLVVSCSALSGPASPPAAPVQPIVSPTAFAIAVPLATATAASEKPTVPATAVRATAPAATPSTSASPKTEPGVPPLILRVDSPADESIVTTPLLIVSGQTTPGAVVSVNDKLADVSSTGAFRLAVTLDEGPNILEVVASDMNGDETSSIVSVIYDSSQ